MLLHRRAQIPDPPLAASPSFKHCSHPLSMSVTMVRDTFHISNSTCISRSRICSVVRCSCGLPTTGQHAALSSGAWFSIRWRGAMHGSQISKFQRREPDIVTRTFSESDLQQKPSTQNQLACVCPNIVSVEPRWVPTHSQGERSSPLIGSGQPPSAPCDQGFSIGVVPRIKTGSSRFRCLPQSPFSSSRRVVLAMVRGCALGRKRFA